MPTWPSRVTAALVRTSADPWGTLSGLAGLVCDSFGPRGGLAADLAAHSGGLAAALGRTVRDLGGAVRDPRRTRLNCDAR